MDLENTMQEMEIDENEINENENNENENNENENENSDELSEESEDYDDYSDSETNTSNHQHVQIKLVPENEKITSNVITLYEMTEAIGLRTTAIEKGAMVYTDVKGLNSARERAVKEFLDRKNPLKIHRTIMEKDGIRYVEEWKVREMTFPVEQI